MATVVGLQIYEPYWPMWRMPSFYAVVLQLNICTTFRMMTFNALQITSDTLARRFKVINTTSVNFAPCYYQTTKLEFAETCIEFARLCDLEVRNFHHKKLSLISTLSDHYIYCCPLNTGFSQLSIRQNTLLRIFLLQRSELMDPNGMTDTE